MTAVSSPRPAKPNALRSPFTPGERRILAEFLHRIRTSFPGDSLDKILVFGSRARRQGHADSDLDLAVFARGTMPAGAHRELAEIAEAIQEGWEDLPHLRPILIGTHERTNRTLLDAIEEDGIVLWAMKSD